MKIFNQHKVEGCRWIATDRIEEWSEVLGGPSGSIEQRYPGHTDFSLAAPGFQCFFPPPLSFWYLDERFATSLALYLENIVGKNVNISFLNWRYACSLFAGLSTPSAYIVHGLCTFHPFLLRFSCLLWLLPWRCSFLQCGTVIRYKRGWVTLVLYVRAAVLALSLFRPGHSRAFCNL